MVDYIILYLTNVYIIFYPYRYNKKKKIVYGTRVNLLEFYLLIKISLLFLIIYLFIHLF